MGKRTEAVGISPDNILLESGTGFIELEDSSGVIKLEVPGVPTLIAKKQNISLNSMTPAFQYIGALNASNYDASLAWDNVTPPAMQYISTISSVAGGTLVYQVGKFDEADTTQGVVNVLNMDAGKDYFVAWSLASTRVLSTGTTWQGDVVTNTITDLVFKGN